MNSSAVVPKYAEAGRSGGDVRSDCRAMFEPRKSGGVEIELTSRVEPYYGENIRAQARRVLADLEIEHARLKIEDMGALPFVIAARIETAVRRAGCGGQLRSRPEAPWSHGWESGTKSRRHAQNPKDRLRRSRLYLPGGEPKYFVNAGQHGPDAIILDLEDSVHPAEKDAARIVVRNALRAVDFNGCERMVRINQLPLGLADLEEVIPEQPDLILVPKVETSEQVQQVDMAIQNALRTSGIEDPDKERAHTVWMMPILESALGIENAFAIATASERNAALTIGLEDYTASMGVVKTREGDESLYARLRLVNAAHAAGLQAIDSVYGDIGDSEGLLTWARRARALGFDGMGCVHPLQIQLIHQAFAPTSDEIARAREIVAAFEDAKARGLGVVALGSKMIDPPVVQRAVKLVQRAQQMGLA